MSIIAPLAVGYIVNESVSGTSSGWEVAVVESETGIPKLIFSQGNVSQWRIVFFVAAGIYFIGNTMFVIFGKTEVQSWNEPQKSPKELEAEQGDAEKPTKDFGECGWGALKGAEQPDLIEMGCFLSVTINLDRSSGNPHQPLERR